MFVRYVSHEIRTPLNVVSVGLQLLKSELYQENGNDEKLNTVNEMSISCEVAVNILNELLDYDKLDEGTMKLELIDMTVEELVLDPARPFYLQVNSIL